MKAINITNESNFPGISQARHLIFTQPIKSGTDKIAYKHFIMIFGGYTRHG